MECAILCTQQSWLVNGMINILEHKTEREHSLFLSNAQEKKQKHKIMDIKFWKWLSPPTKKERSHSHSLRPPHSPQWAPPLLASGLPSPPSLLSISPSCHLSPEHCQFIKCHGQLWKQLTFSPSLESSKAAYAIAVQRGETCGISQTSGATRPCVAALVGSWTGS